MILHAALEVLPVLTEGDGKGWIEIVIEPPGEVVAIELVFFEAQVGELVRIVAEALGVDDEFVEESALALAGVDGEGGAEQTQAVEEVDIGAVFAAIAIDGGEAIAGLEGLADVVIADIGPTGGTDGLDGRGNGLLAEQADKKKDIHRRKLPLAFEP